MIVTAMNLATFYLPPTDSLTKEIGGNYFSFRRTRRGEITCRGDTLSQNFSNIWPLDTIHREILSSADSFLLDK